METFCTEITYREGLHGLVDFKVADPSRLCDMTAFREYWNLLISEYGLCKVGEVYHSFDNGGFTAVVCLTESHMSIHTWPEFSRATADVFLSNYQKENNGKADEILRKTVSFFSGEVLKSHSISR